MILIQLFKYPIPVLKNIEPTSTSLPEKQKSVLPQNNRLYLT